MTPNWRAAALAREEAEASWKLELAEIRAAEAAYAEANKGTVSNCNTFSAYVPPPRTEPELMISTLAEWMMLA